MFSSACHTTRAEPPEPVRRARTKRRLLAATALIAPLAAVLVAGTAAGAAPMTGTKGDPQPELAQFKVGSGSGDGTAIVLEGNTLVLAFMSPSGNKTTVCVVPLGDRKCVSTATLSPETGDSFFGVPEVLSTGGKEVSVVIYDCCHSTPDNVFVYNSTDEGHTFAKFVKAGTIGSVGAGTVAGKDLLVGTVSSGSINVQAFPSSPASPETAFATPNGKLDGDTSLADYRGGVLVASDDLTNTYVEYAKSGNNFNNSSSYKSVGTFKNEDTTTVSGNALLTDPGGSLTGGERLRFFNGTSFGASNKVPDSKAGDDGGFVMQETGATAHVFFEGRRDGYDLFAEKTSNGVDWSTQQRYGSAINSTDLAPALGPTGAGAVLEAGSGSGPVLVQPILNPQSVHIKLAKTKVKPGQSTTLSGTVTPHRGNQLVTLQRKSGALWDTVKTTHETSSGTLSFIVPGKTATYRVVVADVPGYYLFGYSNSVTLTTT